MFQIFNYLSLTFNSPEPWGIFFQDNETAQMEELHNNIMFYLIIILFAVSWIMLSIKLNNKAKIFKYTNHGTLVELIWTMTPVLILVLITFPSFKSLYLMDEVIDPSLVIKCDVYSDSLKNTPNTYAFITVLLQSNFFFIKLLSQPKKTTSQMQITRRNFSCSRCSRTPLEIQREITSVSREAFRQAAENIFTNQNNHSSICFEIAVRDFSLSQRDIYLSRYRVWNNGNDRLSAVREQLLSDPSRTATKKALVEAQADLSTATLQKVFLRDADYYVGTFPHRFLRNERVELSGLLDGHSELWTRFIQNYADYVQDLGVLHNLELVSG